MIKTVSKEDIKKIYKSAFRNVDLRFKNLKESEIDTFIDKTIKNLNILKNKINRS